MNAHFPKQIELTILDLDENLSCYIKVVQGERSAKSFSISLTDEFITSIFPFALIDPLVSSNKITGMLLGS